MFSRSSLALSALLWLSLGPMIVAALDLISNVRYNPPDDWYQLVNSPCETTDMFTRVIGGSALFTFTGNRLQVSGMRNNRSGILEVIIDNGHLLEADTYDDGVTCSLLVDYYLDEGTHNVTILLGGRSTKASPDMTILPELHLTSIAYWTSSPLPSASATSQPTPGSTKHVGTIVGAVVGGVVGLVVVALGLFYFFVGHLPWSTKSRHSFNTANAIHINELSPRSPRSPTSAKIRPYVRMDDDRFSVSGESKIPVDDNLTAPTLSYTGGRDGPRLRSRSPNPDRKSMEA